MKIKERIINGGVLILIFVVAVFIFTKVTNRGNDSMTADMSKATLPQISFSAKEYPVNLLSGYTKEMDIAGMRDTITPVYNEKLKVTVLPYENEVPKVGYKIYTLNGEDILEEGEVKNPKEEMELDLSKEGLLDEERVLKIEVFTGTKNATNFYTRIVRGDTGYSYECINFAHQFHEDAITKKEDSDIATYLEPETKDANENYAVASIHSNIEKINWGSLNPVQEGKIYYDITEIRPSYTSVKMRYQVSIEVGDGIQKKFSVVEFFKVRYVQDANLFYLLDYDRTVEQQIDDGGDILTEKGVIVGITGAQTPYLINSEGSAVSFVQAGEVWCYEKTTDELSHVFGFEDAENKDPRSTIQNYSIKLLSIDKKGNTTFVVNGYMNRGEHEGEAGSSIYYFDIEKNSIDEKLFIASDQSPQSIQYNMGELLYYSVKMDSFYALVDGTLHKIKREDKGKSQEILVENLKKDEYVYSADGRQVAYQENEEVVLLNLESGKERRIAGEEKGKIKPLGFINEDFLYGYSREGDQGKILTGEEVIPMHQLVIENKKGEVVKTYEGEGIYITDIVLEEKMVTLKRAVWSQNTYTPIGDDYIINNEEEKESNINLEKIQTKSLGVQTRITFADGIEDQEPKVLRPKQVLYENPLTISFERESEKENYYVFGYGELKGIYAAGGEAINASGKYNGVVTTYGQRYLWERGNRLLNYQLVDMDGTVSSITEKLKAGQLPLDVLNEMEGYKSVSLSGALTEDVLYILAQNKPIIGVLKDGNMVVLTGYNETNVFYTEVQNAQGQSVPYKDMDNMINDYIGYVEEF